MQNAYSSHIPLIKLAITTTHMSTQQIEYSQLTVILYGSLRFIRLLLHV